jgi:hypothetical protein
MDHQTFGGSTLIARSQNNTDHIRLGDFSPSHISDPESLEYRDTYIKLWGRDNFPTQLIIRITIGAAGVSAKAFTYFLKPPVWLP